MFVTAHVNLTEAWRWQGGTSLPDIIGPDGGVVSPDGNLVVAGAVSIESAFVSDDTYPDLTAARFAVFKLDGQTGNEQWMYEESTASGVEEAHATGVDSEGDVIVGGFTTSSWDEDVSNEDSNREYAAFKLDGSTGDEVWRYQVRYHDDDLTSLQYYSSGSILGLAVDSAGDALFVGHTWGDWVQGEGQHNDSDYTVGKPGRGYRRTGVGGTGRTHRLIRRLVGVRG